MLAVCARYHGSQNTYSDTDGTALAALLGWQGVRLTEVGTPVASSNWNDAELCDDDGGTDSSCDFLGGLDTETDVALRISDNDDGLETRSLTGTSLFLHRLDLHVENPLANIPQSHSRPKKPILSPPLKSML